MCLSLSVPDSFGIESRDIQGHLDPGGMTFAADRGVEIVSRGAALPGAPGWLLLAV